MKQEWITGHQKYVDKWSDSPKFVRKMGFYGETKVDINKSKG